MYKYKLLLLFLISLTIFSNVSANIKEKPLKNKIVYLDAGHGGKDPGAFYKDIYEEDINLEIVLKLKESIEKLGGKVYLTRDGDYDLSIKNASRRKKSDLGNRAKKINESDCDIYLSIHLNSSTNTSWSGAQAFYDDVNKENKDIANKFQEAFNSKLNNSNKKAKKISTLYMYKNTLKPGVLLEVGFISNANERYLLQTDNYQKRIVDTITTSLIEILN